MIKIESDNFADLYTKVIDTVYNKYEYESSPRGMKIRECLNVCLVLTNPLNNLFKCSDDLGKMPTAYTKKEIVLYLNATNSAELFSMAAPFWNNIKNENGTINSAYGNLIFNPSLEDGRSQFDWAYDSLVKDKDSRQAFLRFNNMNHQYEGVKDLPCTFIGIFHIRNNKLNFTIEMRSNDIVKGLIHDEPTFTLIQYLMYLKLKEIYPELELGTYTHIANSLHVYESDFELCERRLKAGLTQNSFPMPKNWRCIKNIDVSRIMYIKVVDRKKGNVSLMEDIEYPENIVFYDWLLS